MKQIGVEPRVNPRAPFPRLLVMNEPIQPGEHVASPQGTTSAAPKKRTAVPASDRSRRTQPETVPQEAQEQGQEQDFRDAYLAKLSELAAELEKPRTLHQKAHDYIMRRLPSFVYLDDYQTFCGTAQLDEIKARKLARERGFVVAGCVGILERAFRPGLLTDLRQAYARLLDSGAFVDPKILANSLDAMKLPSI